MSKRHSLTSEADRILKDFQVMPTDQFSFLYDVEIEADGSVTDLTYGKRFKNLGEWAVFTTRQDMEVIPTFEPLHHGHRIAE